MFFMITIFIFKGVDPVPIQQKHEILYIQFQSFSYRNTLDCRILIAASITLTHVPNELRRFNVDPLFQTETFPLCVFLVPFSSAVQ